GGWRRALPRRARQEQVLPSLRGPAVPGPGRRGGGCHHHHGHRSQGGRRLPPHARTLMNIQPIKPSGAMPSATWRDHADQQGDSLAARENLVRECEAQPEWRSNADLSVAYYDGKQLPEAQKHTVQLEGLEPRVTNLIGRVI